MKWIGLTGGLGTGKSTVAQILKSEGLPVLDADEIAKSVVRAGTPGLKSVIDHFGTEFLNSSGELDRQKMAQLVFSKPDTLLKLEAIIHPLVQAEVLRIRKDEEKKGMPMAFYDVPLLYEKNIKGFDAVVVVVAPPDVQMERLKKRNNWSEAEISNRLKNQLALDKKAAQADYVIVNDGSMEHLKKQVKDLLGKI
jgi:dephospho-CoA kinase